MLERILNFIRAERMIGQGEHVCVGFSGGADSLFLLQALILLRDEGKLRIRLSAVHVNHNLRGEESREDERFVRDWCREHGISLYLFSMPVRERAEASGEGLEEAGRKARRQAFRICRERYGADRIALAHHADDQAETVLFRMARGTGLAGLSGIRPVSGAVIHPLLPVRRAEIEQWLAERGQTWRTDSTNLEEDAARNRIRHRILPEMDEMIQKNAASHIAFTALDLGRAAEYIRRQAETQARSMVREERDGLLIGKEILESDAALQPEILLQCMERLAGKRKDLTRRHVGQLLDLLVGDCGRRCSLPYGLGAEKEADGLYLFRNPDSRTQEPAQEPVSVRMEQNEREILFGRYRIQLRLYDRSALTDEPWKKNQPYTKFTNYDNMKYNFVVRTRKPGDYIVLDKAGRRQTLKAFLINRKIPAGQRNLLPLFACGNEIVWVPGERLGETARITETTRQILEIRISEKEK